MNYRIFLLILVALVGNYFTVCAGKLDDTLHIDEVSVTARIKKYQAGAKVEKIDTVQLSILENGNLETLINRCTPIYVKSNAGGLSTIRFRGTSPDHTSVNLGGINLNSLTLGHSNLSNIPIYLFDEVELQYGSSSAVNGSGSIGGSIHLGLKSNQTNGLNIEVKSALGSFGERLYGTKIFVGNGKLESVTRTYFYEKENNFPFYNLSYDHEKETAYGNDIQHSTAISNKGVLQEINYYFDKKECFNFWFWYEDDWHQIQPKMAVNNADNLVSEEIQDYNLRVWTQYYNQKNALKYQVGLGAVHDNTIQNLNVEKRIQTDRLVSESSVEYDSKKSLGFKAGYKFKYIVPEVYAYNDSIIKYEIESDIYLSYYQYLFKKFKYTFNLRQAYVSGYNPPVTPSLGIEYNIHRTSASVLKITSSIARSYRVSSLNDRFWGVGGNLNVFPEDGMSYETGLDYHVNTNKIKSQFKVSAFYMDVDNWLLWKPGSSGLYEVENVHKVNSQGIEAVAEIQLKLTQIQYALGCSYSYTQTERIMSKDTLDALYQQLEYVPKHKGNVWVNTTFKDLIFSIDGSYTGERYTDAKKENRNKLDEYLLVNTAISYKLPFKSHTLKSSFLINNVFDKDYINDLYYAMPGRNIQFSLTYQFNSLK